MVTLELIDKETIQSESFADEEDFAAVAVKLDENGVATHAGIVIGYRSSIYLFHYTSTEVLLSSIPNKWYFHKKLDLIKGALVPAFHSYCKKVCEKADPEYGYYYGGSMYDSEGNFFPQNADGPQMMTCVGFCLNVILGFIEADDFFYYSDWEASTLENADGYINFYKEQFEREFPECDVEDLLQNVRRIRPDEYYCSGFLEDLPIRKSDVEKILPMIQEVLLEKQKAVA